MQLWGGYESPGDRLCTSSGSLHFSLSDLRSTTNSRGRCSAPRRSSGESRICGIIEDSPLWNPSKVDILQIPLPRIELSQSKSLTCTPNSSGNMGNPGHQLISTYAPPLDSEFPIASYQGALVPGYPNNFRLSQHALLSKDHTVAVPSQCTLSESILDFTSSPSSEPDGHETSFMVILKYCGAMHSTPPSPLTHPASRAASAAVAAATTAVRRSRSHKVSKSASERKVSNPIKLAAWRPEKASSDSRPGKKLQVRKARRENCCTFPINSSTAHAITSHCGRVQTLCPQFCSKQQNALASPPILPKAGIFVNGKVLSIISVEGKTGGPLTNFQIITDEDLQSESSSCCAASSSQNSDSAGADCVAGTRQGCWTCKLRRKKCDGARPICEQCARLNIECHGYSKEKPSFITDPEEGEQMRRKLKLQIQKQKQINARAQAKSRHKKRRQCKRKTVKE